MLYSCGTRKKKERDWLGQDRASQEKGHYWRSRGILENHPEGQL